MSDRSTHPPSRGRTRMGAHLRAVRDHLSPDDLVRRSNRTLDRLYRDSDAGPVPAGRGTGTAVFWPGTRLAPVLARLVRAVAWKGKAFDPARHELANLIGPFGVRAVRAKVFVGPSWVDGGECVVLDYSRTSLLARPVRDEIRLVAPGTYLGVAWLGRHRVAWFVLRFDH